jgi:hypothetical protein
VVGALPDALVAVWLGLIARGLSGPGAPDRTLLLIAGMGIAFSCVGGWVVTSGSQRLHDRFRQRLAVALETHVARLQATTWASSSTSDPRSSTGWRCCATRCSRSTTSSCRSSARSASPSASWS